MTQVSGDLTVNLSNRTFFITDFVAFNQKFKTKGIFTPQVIQSNLNLA